MVLTRATRGSARAAIPRSRYTDRVKFIWTLSILLLAVTILLSVPLSRYSARSMDGRYKVPRALVRIEGKLNSGPQNWKQYVIAMLAFTLVPFTYGFGCGGSRVRPSLRLRCRRFRGRCDEHARRRPGRPYARTALRIAPARLSGRSGAALRRHFRGGIGRSSYRGATAGRNHDLPLAGPSRTRAGPKRMPGAAYATCRSAAQPIACLARRRVLPPSGARQRRREVGVRRSALCLPVSPLSGLRMP